MGNSLKSTCGEVQKVQNLERKTSVQVLLRCVTLAKCLSHFSIDSFKVGFFVVIFLFLFDGFQNDPHFLGNYVCLSAYSLLIANWILPIKCSPPAGLIKGKCGKLHSAMWAKEQKSLICREKIMWQRGREEQIQEKETVLVHS